jgi:ATP-dependent helicase/nuclease subunit A
MAREDRAIPLPALTADERVGRVAAEHARAQRAEDEEHWRLLYVAMTRAEEALFIGGALGAREQEPAEGSWYAQLRLLFGADEWIEDSLWQGRLEYGEAAEPVLAKQPAAQELPLAVPLPRWLESLPPAEPRPPRPLAPSALGEDVSPDPPFPPGAGNSAARRGVLIHKLLERLPEIAPVDRSTVAELWLKRNAPEFAAETREALVRSVIEVLSRDEWADLFAPGGLAEVPVAAVVGGRVVAGEIDRLVIAPDRIRLVDFKTARRPPRAIDEVPMAVLRQMAAYAAALEAAYPGRTIEAALLYTAAPRLITIPAQLLAQHKQALLAAE